MPSLWKAFSLSSSSSTSSSSPTDSPNTRRIYGGGRRLTRQRKLRHVSDDDLGLRRPNIQALIIDDRSKSLPLLLILTPISGRVLGRPTTTVTGPRTPPCHCRCRSLSSILCPNKTRLTLICRVRVDRDPLSPPPADLSAEGVEFRLNSSQKCPKPHHHLQRLTLSKSSPTRVINSADHSPLCSPVLPSSANGIRNNIWCCAFTS
ncbi:hypothetical protein HAX54_043687 [Datura stramonium]|uniref:Uncharacterized protein n=1 Tax=Datura stramonium TaxID=4076 RepID=A0ABS8SNT7_DATST|nr:hypothetical protein [Datura stramonium]